MGRSSARASLKAMILLLVTVVVALAPGADAALGADARSIMRPWWGRAPNPPTFPSSFEVRRQTAAADAVQGARGAARERRLGGRAQSARRARRRRCSAPLAPHCPARLSRRPWSAFGSTHGFRTITLAHASDLIHPRPRLPPPARAPCRH